MTSNTKTWKSEPIWHINGRFRVNLVQFKSSIHGQSVGIKTDFMRAARSLCNEDQGEILAFPKTMPFQSRNQHQAQHGQIILVTSQFCNWSNIRDCLEKNGLELSNETHNIEMNPQLLQNGLKCMYSFIFIYLDV